MPTSSRRRDAAADARLPVGRLGDPAQDLQQRALAGAVAADDADDLAGLNGKRHVLERPEFGALAGEIADSTGSFVPKTRERTAPPPHAWSEH